MSTAAVHLLILIIAANSVPVLLSYWCADKYACAIDGGHRFIDGKPLFGHSKTWRGLIGALTSGIIIAPLLGHSMVLGATAASTAMLGDLCSSFTKRRVNLAPSAQAPLLDQIPEALLPALVLQSTLPLSWIDVLLITAGFVLVDMIFSILFYRLGIRKTPH